MREKFKSTELIKDLISVVIPVYNGEKTIGKAVKSVIEQTYNKVEIIVVDDGSTDDTYKIVRNIADELNTLKQKSKDWENIKDLKIIRQENKGVSSARNVGLKNIQGEYVIFIDADDWVEDNMFEEFLKETKEHNLDLVQGNYVKEYIAKTIPVKHYKVKEEVYSSRKDIIDIKAATISNNKISESFFSLARQIHGKMFKTEIIFENNLKFKEKLEFHEDLIFNVEYLNYAKRIKYIQKYFLHFTQKDDREEIISNAKDVYQNLKRIIRFIKVNFRKTAESKAEKELLELAFAYFGLEILSLYYNTFLKNTNNLQKVSIIQRRKLLISLANDTHLFKYISKLNKKELFKEEKSFLNFVNRNKFYHNVLFGKTDDEKNEKINKKQEKEIDNKKQIKNKKQKSEQKSKH